MALRSARGWELSLTTVELFSIAFPLSCSNFWRPNGFPLNSEHPMVA